jgi:hypothetical protein
MDTPLPTGGGGHDILGASACKHLAQTAWPVVVSSETEGPPLQRKQSLPGTLETRSTSCLLLTLKRCL